MTDRAPFSHARILVIDDERANVDLLDQMLRRAGYPNVTTTQHSTAAVPLFGVVQPDLVLVVLHMPDPDGFTLLRQFRELQAHDDYLPIVVLTADVTDETKERALAGGANDFLTKPFQYAELLLRIGNFLETRRLHLALKDHTAAIEQQLERVTRTEREQREERLATIERINNVLTDRSVAMVFQPVVNLFDGSVAGAEALARFSAEPRRTPDRWFAEAAGVGLGVDLEAHAIDLAVDQLGALPGGTFLSVNASPETVLSSRLMDIVESVPSTRLVLELTEHEQIDDYRAIDEVSRTLRDLGVRLAVDDTGSGYASLRHILRLSPDIIKLDRDLIFGVDADPARRALASALVHFASDIGAMVIAEGIETTAELEVLRDLGVEFGQGYLMARPGPLPILATIDLSATEEVEPAPAPGAPAPETG
jgi:EAL domain-containing protein (putative c-di-GMP-specific phosphodiesterase class I)/AmiR/NasT family two-component response regulator